MTDLPATSLSRRALSFLRAHGKRIPGKRVEGSAALWIQRGVDEVLVRRAVEYERRWGDLYLPPSVLLNGGPKFLGPDVLLGHWSDDGYLEAGPARYSVFYDFLIGPDGEFGVGDSDFVPLYVSVEGWIESLAFEYELRGLAAETRVLRGSDVLSIDLTAMSPLSGVSGLSESWMIDAGRVVLVSRATSLVSGYQDDVVAIVYSGIRDRDSVLEMQ